MIITTIIFFVLEIITFPLIPLRVLKKDFIYERKNG